MVSKGSLEDIFASDKGILMAVVNGRFLVAENASISIEHEYDYSGVIAANTMSHGGTKSKESTITIEFDTRRDPYIQKDILGANRRIFRLYNQEYKLLLENCFYSYLADYREDEVVSQLKVESAGELTISER